MPFLMKFLIILKTNYMIRYFLLKMPALFTAILFLLFGMSGNSFGQFDSSSYTPGKHVRFFDSVADIHGKTYSLGSVAVDDSIRARSSGSAYSALSIASCSSGYFNLYIESGSGFDTSTAAMAVLCKVCHDISAFIHSPLTTTGQKINLWVQNNSSIPYHALGGAVSFYILPQVDSGYTGGIADNTVWQTIMTGHDPYKDIAFPLLGTPGASSGATFFHAAMIFNFSAITWNFDYTIPPPAGTYDMYTTLLHELTHALGFTTEMDATGNSVLDYAGQYYSRYDRFLHDSSGLPSIHTLGLPCGIMYGYDYYGIAGISPDCSSPYIHYDTTPCPSALHYIDGIINVPVNSPFCFRGGSSLSHFEDQCYSAFPSGWPLSAGAPSNDQYFLMSNTGRPGPYSPTANPGAMKRHHSWEERQVLCDIGYNVADTFGDVTSLNGFHFSGGTCPGLQVAGRNDGVDTTGSITFFSPTTGSMVIQINGTGMSPGLQGLLKNDINADSFECLQIVTGGHGSLTATRGDSSTIVKYTPSPADNNLILLRYVPVNAATGNRGNITYVFIGITRNPGCATISPCELVINGNFNAGEGSNCGGTSSEITSPPAQICNWQRFTGTPDLFTNGCTRTITGAYSHYPGSPFLYDGSGNIIYDPAGDSTSFIGLYGGYGGNFYTCIADTGWTGEGVQTELAAPLVNGQQYILNFDGLVSIAYYNNGPFQWRDIPVQFFVSHANMQNYVAGGCYGADPFDYSAIASLHVLDTSHRYGFNIPFHTSRTWQHLTDTFTYYGPDAIDAMHPQFLQMVSAPYYETLPAGTIPSVTFRSYVYIDNISLKPIISISTSRTSMCLGEPFTLTTTGTSFPDSMIWYRVTGSTLAPVDTTMTTHDSTGVHGAATIYPPSSSYYTAMDRSLGCVFPNIYETVYPLPTAYFSGTTDICIGDTTTLTAHGAASYVWFDSAGIVSTDTFMRVHPAATTTYSVAMMSIHHCLDTTTVTVTVGFLPAHGSITGSHSVCVGADDTLHNPVAGGHWASLLPSVASIGFSTGIAHGLASGSANIIYIVSNACGTGRDTFVLNVYPRPAAGIISGSDSVCAGATIALSASVAGGSWASANTAVASVSTSGVVTGGSVTTGTSVVIYYLVTSGCGTDTARHTVRVNPAPAPITATPVICGIFIDTLSDIITGGYWSTSSSIASVSGTGVVRGGGAGTATITYTLIAGGCYKVINVFFDTIPSLSAGNDKLNCSGVPLIASVGGVTTAVPGYSYSWTPATGLSATNVYNPLANPVVTTSYIVTATNTLSGCHASDTVTIMKLPAGSVCNPCSDFGSTPFSVLGITGVINSNVPAGNYYIPATVTVSGNIKFTDAVVEIADGASINVGNTSQLRVEGSHLYSCATGMWAGLSLLSSGTHMGNLTLTGNLSGKSTLIEDAKQGVSITVASYTPILAAGTAYYLISDNTIFNRNHVGMAINNYFAPATAIAGDTLSYEFQVKNTVFTSRDFSLFTQAGAQYPYRWPNTTGSFGLKTYWNPATLYPGYGDYMSPFNIINPHAGPATTAYPGGVPYPGKPCHDTLPRRYGMMLVNLGTGLGGSYAGISVGKPGTDSINRELNLFDTLMIGIYTLNANVTVRNCAFANAHTTWSPSGIYSNCNNYQKYQLTIEPGTWGSVISPNQFYGCRCGVQSTNYYRIKGNGSKIIASYPNGLMDIGYMVNSRSYDSIIIAGNNICNITRGVGVNMLGSGTVVYGSPGHLNVSNNRILATLPSSTGFTGSLSSGIFVQNSIAYIGFGTTPNQVNVNDNYIKDVWSGIYINGIGTQVAICLRDTVYSQCNSSLTFGIWHTACNNSVIQKCIISGSDFKFDSSYGIRSSYGFNNLVSCNYVSNVGRGFQFDNTHLGNSWLNNTMNNCRKGFVLKAASIGTQGDYHHASSNQWTATGGFGWGFGSGHYQTFTEGLITPTSSSLWVRSGGISDPVINRHASINCASTYGCNTSTGVTSGSGNGLAVTSFPYLPLCVVSAMPSGTKLDHVATGSVGIAPGDFHKQHCWTAQNKLWEAIVQNDTLGDSSAVLTAFKAMASGSRYALLTQVENLIATGDLLGAQSILTGSSIDDNANTNVDTLTGVVMADSTDASVDSIINNYRAFYGMYIRYQLGSFTAFDSVRLDSLASSCPITNGAVVYKARALYNELFSAFRIFDNDCGAGLFISDSFITDTTVIRDSIADDSTANKTSHQSGNNIRYVNGDQQYELHPNPNKGNFNVRQYMRDEGDVIAEIYDAVGREVFKAIIKFTNPEVELNMQKTPPGLYLLRLRDTGGRQFNFKFVVQ